MSPVSFPATKNLVDISRMTTSVSEEPQFTEAWLSKRHNPTLPFRGELSCAFFLFVTFQIREAGTSRINSRQVDTDRYKSEESGDYRKRLLGRENLKS